MINIITEKPDRKYKYSFDDCESFFRLKVHSKQFTDTDIRVMQLVDNARLLDRNTGAMTTDFGVGSIDNLSTGCKTVLTYLFIQRNRDYFENDILIDVTECGSNALDVLFDVMEEYDNSEVTLLLLHNNNLFMCKEQCKS